MEKDSYEILRMKLWKDIYVTAIRNGATSYNARHLADSALEDFEMKFKKN
jgi:hypothetical protein